MRFLLNVTRELVLCNVNSRRNFEKQKETCCGPNLTRYLLVNKVAQNRRPDPVDVPKCVRCRVVLEGWTKGSLAESTSKVVIREHRFNLVVQTT